MRLDIIGDVHGHADALAALLQRLGYGLSGGAFRHPGGRRAVFVGDLIDRGPEQIRTVRIVRAMVEAGSALAVMGNHEFDALAFAAPDPRRPAEPPGPRRSPHPDQRAAFLRDAGGAGSPLYADLLAFFAAMPLWLDLDGVGIVHACWSRAHMAALAPSVDAGNRLTREALPTALTPGTEAHAACAILLRGPEIRLPPGPAGADEPRSGRGTTRTRWWDAAATTIRAAAVERAVAKRLPEEPLPPHLRIPLDETRPVFFGHYCLKARPHLLTARRTCLDFCVAKGGALCAYRFDGEPELDAAKLVWVG